MRRPIDGMKEFEKGSGTILRKGVIRRQKEKAAGEGDLTPIRTPAATNSAGPFTKPASQPSLSK